MYTNLLWEVIFFSYWSFLIHLQFVYYTAHDHLLLQCWIFLPHLQSHPKINSFDNTVLVYDLNVIPWHHMNHWSSCKHLAMPVKKENDLIRNTGSILGMPKLTLDTALPFLFKDAISLTRSMSTTFVVNVLIKMALCLLSCLLSLTAWIKTKLITKKFSNAAK